MIIVLDAAKLAVEKVIGTILNIIVFRHTFAFTKEWLNSYIAFFVTIYLVGKITGLVYYIYMRIRKALLPKSLPSDDETFEANYLESVNLSENDNRSKYATLIERMKFECVNNLFMYVFSSAMQSTIMSLGTIISIEYLNSNYEYTLIHALALCVSISFLICFASSMRYASVIGKEWTKKSTDAAGDKNEETQALIVYNKSKKQNADVSEKDYVCLWISKLDSETKRHNVELKFLSSKYADNFLQIVEFYISKNMSLPSSLALPQLFSRPAAASASPSPFAQLVPNLTGLSQPTTTPSPIIPTPFSTTASQFSTNNSPFSTLTHRTPVLGNNAASLFSPKTSSPLLANAGAFKPLNSDFSNAESNPGLQFLNLIAALGAAAQQNRNDNNNDGNNNDGNNKEIKNNDEDVTEPDHDKNDEEDNKGNEQDQPETKEKFKASIKEIDTEPSTEKKPDLSDESEESTKPKTVLSDFTFLNKPINNLSTIGTSPLDIKPVESSTQSNSKADFLIEALKKLQNSLSMNQGQKKPELYTIIVPDYYNLNQNFSSFISKKGFKKAGSWKEFSLIPDVNYKVTIYQNKDLSLNLNTNPLEKKKL
jgi:hypothetical protein